MHQWNILDWLIVCYFVVWVVRGYVRGFISQLVSLVGMFIALLAAYMFHGTVAPWIAKILPVTSWSSYEQYELIIHSLNLEQYFYNAVAFGLIFLAVKLGLTLLSHVLNLIAKVPGLKLLNKLSGLVLATCEAVVVIVIGISVMGAIPTDGLQRLVTQSVIAGKVEQFLPLLVNQLHELWMRYI